MLQSKPAGTKVKTSTEKSLLVLLLNYSFSIKMSSSSDKTVALTAPMLTSMSNSIHLLLRVVNNSLTKHCPDGQTALALVR